jgi:hypothetical protein
LHADPFELVPKAIGSGALRNLAARAEIPNDLLAESIAEGPNHTTTILAKISFQFFIRNFENPTSAHRLKD